MWRRDAAVIAIAALLLAFPVSFPAGAAQFSFAAFGDTPYNEAEEAALVGIIAEMNRAPLAFSVHVGDFKSAQSECSDALYRQRREWFGLSHHPFIFVPGDNEWVDCARAFWAPRDPLERLAKLRKMFFGSAQPLGQRALALARQTQRGYPEHLRWITQNVVFATVNVPGPNNHAARPDESKPRTRAVLDWLREAFRIARERTSPGVVIFVHANIFTGSTRYAPMVAALTEEASRYDGSVLVIHGDTHRYRFDQPLGATRSGRAVENLWRLEVFGSPSVNWVHVDVDVAHGRARFNVTPGSKWNGERR